MMADEHPSELDFRCPKCGHKRYEVGELRGTGGILSKIFDVQRERFTTVTCRRCQYTELYKTDSSLLGDVFDFFTQ